MTITILTFICATSLYIASQNANAGLQAAGWQQALTGSENGVTKAIDALNTGTWTGWNTVGSSSLPTTQPTGGNTAGAAPTGNQYSYYLLSSINMTGESNNSVSGWVTVDNIPNMSQTTGGSTFPWYRIRATGTASAASGSWRRWASSNRLDNDLRKISLNWDRVAGGAIGTPKASRTIEIIAQPVLQTSGGAGYGWVMKGSTKFSGMEMMDSFNSNYGSYASQATHTYTANGTTVHYANSNIEIGIQDTTGSNLNNQLVFGSVIYSGPTLKGTGADAHGYGGVQGTVSTPYNGTIAPVTDPTSGSWIALGSGTQVITTGSGTNYYKYTGDWTMNSGQSLTAKVGSGSTGTIIVLVTGNINLNAQNNVIVQNGVTFKIYGDNDINFQGDSFNNQNVNGAGGPVSTSMYVYGVSAAGKTIISDDAANPTQTFVGVIYEPGYYINVKSSFSMYGSVTGSTTQTSAAAKYHYDEALGTVVGGGSTTVANYAYASWFEDNSDPVRKDRSGNLTIY